jgi:hypothetical protein
MKGVTALIILPRTIRSALLLASAFLVPLGTASAQSTTDFELPYHSVGEGTGERCWENLCVEIAIKQVNVPGLNGNSRICATFRNASGQEWAGGYRLSNNPGNRDRTHASIRIAANSTAERCETLSVTKSYYVVLRQNRS